MNPGSDEAIAAGCKCPIMDNAHGRGAWGTQGTDDPVFIMTVGCPVHAQELSETEEEPDDTLRV